MVRAVSIKDVAVRAGVSLGTVSNVLNRPEVVAPATLGRVQQAILDLGFVRNESARQLRAGRSRMVGLVVLDVANPFFTDLARGAEAALQEVGLAVMLCSSDDQPDKEARYLGLLEEQRVQGVLISPVDEKHRGLAALRRRGTPVVLVDRTSGSRAQCSVAVDDVLGGRLAAEHLLERGHRRISFVGGPLSLRQVRDRVEGARSVVIAKRGASLALHETTGLNVAEGRRVGAEIAAAAKGSRPTAVFCANDLLALGLLQSLMRGGLRVPGDIAIVGYDDIDFAAAAAVPLSSVRQPRQELGRAAAGLLIDEALHKASHRHRQMVFQPVLVVRDSSDPDARRSTLSSLECDEFTAG